MATLGNINTIVYQEYTGVETFQALADVLGLNAHADVSFWGWRYVYADNYEGAIYLDDLIRRVKRLSTKPLKNPDFNKSEIERKIGKALMIKLMELDDVCIEKIKHANFITRTFFHIRFLWESTCPWLLLKRSNETFCTYTREQYIQCFGGNPDEKEKHSSSTTYPDHWVVMEEGRRTFQKGFRFSWYDD